MEYWHFKDKLMKRSFTAKEAKKIGDRIGVDWKQVDLSQFQMGLSVELEHGKRDADTNVTDDNLDKTGKIALAHLREGVSPGKKSDYYTKLKEMEDEMKKAIDAMRTSCGILMLKGSSDVLIAMAKAQGEKIPSIPSNRFNRPVVGFGSMRGKMTGGVSKERADKLETERNKFQDSLSKVPKIAKSGKAVKFTEKKMGPRGVVYKYDKDLTQRPSSQKHMVTAQANKATKEAKTKEDHEAASAFHRFAMRHYPEGTNQHRYHDEKMSWHQGEATGNK